jgi:hypothetical protein
VAAVLDVAVGQSWRVGHCKRLDRRGLSGKLVRVTSVLLSRDLRQSVAYVRFGAHSGCTVRLRDLAELVEEPSTIRGTLLP